MQMLTIEELINMAAEHRASDVHLSAGVQPKFRIDSLLYNAENTEPLTCADCLAYAERLAGDRFKEVEDGAEDLTVQDAYKPKDSLL